MTVETSSGGEPVTKSGPYNGDGSTAAFDYDFQITAEDQLVVTRQNADGTETELTLTTDYTVSGVGNDAGGQITLVDPAGDLPSGTKLVIQYSGDFNQSTNYSNQGAIQLSLLEASLDKLTMHMRQLKEVTDRSATVDVFNTVDVETLRNNINTLAGIDSDITTVAGISANVTTVAGISADVTTVAGISANVTTVAGIDTDVTTVAGISADVQTLADIEDGTTATGAIQTVAGISADVTTVAGISANVTTVAGISADVTTVAGISTNVTTVAGIDTDVTTVAGISADVTAVAGISADVQIAAANVADITNFASVYLGPAASDPGTRTDGSALQLGDLYFNTTEDEMRVYDGTTPWAAAYASLAGALLASNNLSDVDNAATSRTNLGLGTAATHNVPASGDAATGEVVKGNDTRLSDARTPTAHTHTLSEITDSGEMAALDKSSQAQAEAGTSDSVGMTPLRTKQAIDALAQGGVFTETYESSEISIPSSNTQSNFAHGLTGKPKLIYVCLICKTAELNYEVGDEVRFDGLLRAGATGGNTGGFSVSCNSTHVVISMSGNNIQIQDESGSGNSSQDITASRWRIRVRAYR